MNHPLSVFMVLGDVLCIVNLNHMHGLRFKKERKNMALVQSVGKTIMFAANIPIFACIITVDIIGLGLYFLSARNFMYGFI